jgi:hypothetical protein
MFFLPRPSCKKFSFNFLLSISSAALALMTINPAQSMEQLETIQLESGPSQSVKSERCLTFLDVDQPKDQLSFLSTKFPELIMASQRARTKEASNLDMSSKKFLKGMAKKVFASPYDSRMFETIIDSQNQRFVDLLELKEYRNRHPASTVFEEFFYREKSKSDITLLKDIALAAHHIEDILIRKGNAPVLFLGRTPCLIQVAYEELCKLKHPGVNFEKHSIHLSFSGTPDALSLHTALAYRDEGYNVKRNMVTPEKLDFYEDYLTQKGLNKISQKLYVVDMIGTGGSLNSFLRLMRYYYETHLQQDMPDMHFLCLSLVQGRDHHAEFGTWKHNQKSQMLTFNSDSEHGIRPLEIMTTPLQLCRSTLENLLDYDFFQKNGTHGIEFPAQNWRNEFKLKLSEGGKWHKDVYNWLRPKLRELINLHENQLIDERDKLVD